MAEILEEAEQVAIGILHAELAVAALSGGS